MRWVQKVSESGEAARYYSLVVMDDQAKTLGIPLDGVSEEDARAMVATGDWKYVSEERSTH